jgi:hypothetical protein
VTIEPNSFDFLILSNNVGLRVNRARGKSVTVPMSADTAEQVGKLLLAHAQHIRTR